MAAVGASPTRAGLGAGGPAAAADTARTLELLVLARLREVDQAHVLAHRTPPDAAERAWRMRLLGGCVRRAVSALAAEAHHALGAQVTESLATIPMAVLRLPADPRLGVDAALRGLRDLPSVVLATARRADLARVASRDAPGAAAAAEHFGWASLDPATREWSAAAPRARSVPDEVGDDAPLVGVIERGRPDLRHPAMPRSAAAAATSAGNVLLHPHATAVAAALFGGALAPAPRAAFWSVSRDCRQPGWLAAADALVWRGARVLNLSAGVRPADLDDGWELFERGLDAISALHGVTVVAAAGGVPASDGLLVPARDPAVLAVGAAGLASTYALDRPELLAAEQAPLGDSPGTSFAAPRIAALVAQAMSKVPRASVDPVLARALLMAALPEHSRVPDPARLHRLIARSCFAWGDQDSLVPVRAEGDRKLTAVLAWCPWALRDLLLSINQSPVDAPRLEVGTISDGSERVVAGRAHRSWALLRADVAERPALRVRSRGIPWALAWHLENAAAD